MATAPAVSNSEIPAYRIYPSERNPHRILAKEIPRLFGGIYSLFARRAVLDSTSQEELARSSIPEIHPDMV